MKLKTILLLLLLFALVACSPAGDEPAVSDNLLTNTPDLNEPASSTDPTTTPLPDKPSDPENIILDQAQVNSIAIAILESFPVQVHVSVTGFLGDGCTTLADITMTKTGNTFFIDISKQRPADMICTQQLTTFEELIALDVNGLLAGTYTVDVNGVSDSFTLDMDNVANLPDTDGEEPPYGVDLQQEDVAELLRLTLDRALIAQEIPDYQLLTADRDTIILSTENINTALVPEIAGVNLLLFSPEEIQDKANAEGDFLYLRFVEITAVSPTKALVSLDNIWITSANSDTGYLSGGGFTIEYTKTAAGWHGEVTEMWIS
ncbi:MAG: hypothetical protein GY805_04765 [Chloroflexi bacterium]|nr:hypothetical protein [Chloroflexota bacterium]